MLYAAGRLTQVTTDDGYLLKRFLQQHLLDPTAQCAHRFASPPAPPASPPPPASVERGTLHVSFVLAVLAGAAVLLGVTSVVARRAYRGLQARRTAEVRASLDRACVGWPSWWGGGLIHKWGGDWSPCKGNYVLSPLLVASWAGCRVTFAWLVVVLIAQTVTMMCGGSKLEFSSSNWVGLVDVYCLLSSRMIASQKQGES